MAKRTRIVEVRTIYKCADALLSPLGTTTDQNWKMMVEGRSGIELHEGVPGFPASFWGARIPDHFLDDYQEDLTRFTRFERLMIMAAREALSHTEILPASEDVLFIIATTKGNIDLIDPEQPHSYDPDRVLLWRSAQLVADYFGNRNAPLVISQACISGVSALLMGMEVLKQSRYKYAIVIGADVFSRFTFSGFSSLQALAGERCRPFDARRQGLNLGEASACMVLTNETPEAGNRVRLHYGLSSNDAHHLSAPSRTGEGLYRAMMQCLEQIDYTPDFLNVHGTATVFNDQMESVALTRAGLSHLPLTACKGYFGHTLGAAGLVDAIVAARCMEEGLLLPVLGFEEPGTEPVCVQKLLERRTLRSCLKTASGFGGSNAVLLMER